MVNRIMAAILIRILVKDTKMVESKVGMVMAGEAILKARIRARIRGSLTDKVDKLKSMQIKDKAVLRVRDRAVSDGRTQKSWCRNAIRELRTTARTVSVPISGALPAWLMAFVDTHTSASWNGL